MITLAETATYDSDAGLDSVQDDNKEYMAGPCNILDQCR